MDVSTSWSGQHCTLHLAGDLTFRMEDKFHDAYQNLEQKPTKITVDLRQSQYIDSSGLAMLLVLREYATNNGMELELMISHRDVAAIFRTACFDRIFTISGYKDKGSHYAS